MKNNKGYQEKLLADLSKEQGRFSRKVDRLRRVRQHLESHGGGRFAGVSAGGGGFGEGGEGEGEGEGAQNGDAFSDTSSGVYSDLSEMSGSTLTSIASTAKCVCLLSFMSCFVVCLFVSFLL